MSSQPPSQPPSRSPSPSYAAVVAGAVPTPRRQSARLAPNTASSPIHPRNQTSLTPAHPMVPSAPPVALPVIPPTASAVPPQPASLVSADIAPRPHTTDISRPLQDRQPRAVPTTKKPKGKGKQNTTPPQQSPTTPVASSSRARQPQVSRQHVADVQADMLTQAATLASLEQTVRAHRVAALRDLEHLSARLNGKGPAPEPVEPTWTGPLGTLTHQLEDMETVLRADLVDTDRDLSRRIAAVEDRILVLERRGDLPQVRTRPQPASPSPPDRPPHSRASSHTQRSTSRSASPRPCPPQQAPITAHAKRPRSPPHDLAPAKPAKKSKSSKHHPERAVSRPPRSYVPPYTVPPPPGTSVHPSSHPPYSGTNISPLSLPSSFSQPPALQTQPPFVVSAIPVPAPISQDTLAPAEAAYLRLHGVRLTAHDTDIWSSDRARNHRVFRDIVLHLPHQQPPIPDPNRNTHISARISDFFFQSPDDLVTFLLAWEARSPDLFNLSASRIPSSLLGDIVARDPPVPGPSRRPNGNTRGRGGFWQNQGGRTYDTAPY